MDSIESLRNFTSEVNLKYILAGIAVLAVTLSFTQLEVPQTDSSNVETSITVSTPDNNITRDITVKNTTTVFEALNTTFDINYSESSLGYLITGIERTQSNDNNYWLYFVNGENPGKGAGQVLVKEGDNIVFRYLNQSQANQYIEN